MPDFLFIYTDKNPSKTIHFYDASLKYKKVALNLDQEQRTVKQLRI